MPYIVKTGKGDRPYQIINQKTREVVGTSKTLKNAYGSIAHRTDAEEKKVSNFKFKKDNFFSLQTFIRKSPVLECCPTTCPL